MQWETSTSSLKKSEINFKDDSVLFSDNVNFFLRCVMYCYVNMMYFIWVLITSKFYKIYASCIKIMLHIQIICKI